MANKVAAFSGTNWAGGDILKAAELLGAVKSSSLFSHGNRPQLASALYAQTFLQDYSNSVVTLTRGKINRFRDFTLSSQALTFTGGSVGDPCLIYVNGDFTMSGGSISVDGLGQAGGTTGGVGGGGDGN